MIEKKWARWFYNVFRNRSKCDVSQRKSGIIWKFQGQPKGVWDKCAYEHFKKRNFCPAGNYIFKLNNKNTRTRCKICSKLTIKTPERRYWRRSGIFIVNFEQVNVGWGRIRGALRTLSKNFRLSFSYISIFFSSKLLVFSTVYIL